jgi:hypothetical protein
MKNLQNLLIVLLLIQATISYGQAGLSNPDDIEKIKQRTFLVMLEEPKQDLMEKLKPEEQENYTADINAYNSMMQELMPALWKISAKLEFKKRSEIMELIKSKDQGYAYLEYEKYRVQFANVSSLRMTFKSEKGEKMGGLNPVGETYIASSISIRLTEKANTSLEIISIPVASPFPSKGEMALAVKEILYTFDKRASGIKTMQLATLPKKEAKKLEKMKLLVNADDTDASEEAIKKVYPYPFELVKGKEALDAAILTGDSGTAVIKIIPNGNRSYSYKVFSCSEGGMLASSNSSENGGVYIGPASGLQMAQSVMADRIRAEHFKLIATDIKNSIKYEK